MSTAFAELEQRWAEIRDLENGLSILGWDQQVMMPPAGAGTRAHTLATLSGLVHERCTDDGLVKLVRRLSRKDAGLTPRQRRAVSLVSHRVDKARAVPADLARRLAEHASACLQSWQAARAAADWSLFADDLARMVDLKREEAAARRRKGPLYDVLLDDFEPEATCAEVDPLLAELKAITVKLLARVRASAERVDLSPFVGRFEVAAQRAFTRQLVEAMGIDLGRGRLDLSTHPFCGGVAPDDVRMTSRYDRRDMRGGLFGAVHEAGHGLYEQGLDRRRARTPLGGAISMAIHESQSRLWENNVARSRPFWDHWAPRLRKAHPSLRGVKAEAFWRAANHIAPSPIRVEADELTYTLHIILRHEIERELIEGRTEVADLPARWNAGMVELLGLEPKDDAQGVLQDIHWGMGAIGYFPTYSLGNLYAAQFMEAARKAIRGLDRKIASGDLQTLRDWLADKIHRHDQVYTAEALVKRVTGKPLGTEAFGRHIRKKVKAIY